MVLSAVGVAAVMVLFLDCSRYAPVSRRLGETCDETTDCVGDLYCNSHGICTGGSSGGSSGSSSGSTTTSSSACSPSCDSSSLCVKDRDGYASCLSTCYSDSDCYTCCVGTTTGDSVCAPDSSYCQSSSGGGSCPSGTYQETEGGPCVTEPSSCPNGWVVCNCPEEHGAWCHPDVCEPGGPTAYCGGSPQC